MTLENRAVLAVDGPDAAAFLQGLITHDVGLLAPGRALFAGLLSPQGKGFRAITANADAIKWLRVEPVERDRLNALWRPQAAGVKLVRLAGALGPDGRPTGCRVFESSGSDLADTAACRLFRSEARFTPASDAFGQPGNLTGWVNLQLTPP